MPSCMSSACLGHRSPKKSDAERGQPFNKNQERTIHYLKRMVPEAVIKDGMIRLGRYSAPVYVGHGFINVRVPGWMTFGIPKRHLGRHSWVAGQLRHYVRASHDRHAVKVNEGKRLQDFRAVLPTGEVDSVTPEGVGCVRLYLRLSLDKAAKLAAFLKAL